MLGWLKLKNWDFVLWWTSMHQHSKSFFHTLMPHKWWFGLVPHNTLKSIVKLEGMLIFSSDLIKNKLYATDNILSWYISKTEAITLLNKWIWNGWFERFYFLELLSPVLLDALICRNWNWSIKFLWFPSLVYDLMSPVPHTHIHTLYLFLSF